MPRYVVKLAGLTGSDCIEAIRFVAQDLDDRLGAVVTIDGNFDPIFCLPDRPLSEKEFFQYVGNNCPEAVAALRELLTILLARWRHVPGREGHLLWKDETATALAYALAALVMLDRNSWVIAESYMDGLGCNPPYFRGQFYEDVASSGCWRDPNWLSLALPHLCGDYADGHWSALGFREAVLKLPNAEAFLRIFCAEFEGDIVPKSVSPSEDLEVADWIDENLAEFVRNCLSADPIDVWLRSELVRLRPSVADRL